MPPRERAQAADKAARPDKAAPDKLELRVKAAMPDKGEPRDEAATPDKVELRDEAATLDKVETRAPRVRAGPPVAAAQGGAMLPRVTTAPRAASRATARPVSTPMPARPIPTAPSKTQPTTHPMLARPTPPNVGSAAFSCVRREASGSRFCNVPSPA
jgi:hypothetical protein